ncbi:Membrane-anchored ribosome-binding protein, inhibits growth in stationary phase, ElaB/YqjD/DUF883 family [Modicisalibacter ilicicola DSM 19980]|uniref:Membrane-anchored ribosome-binding protein, inhibits growth in stationary phase, ElaB/YqjD/DUF883 family n=1 Tax=Modicisalibacter ilicicola DSM 19980 TaxID=1121942 RepID=A0A1M4YI93_9GAMM|nr:DUF883 family protein [Halomonas ilicicola]SHF05176.1 Membrane-anchored ribosome-binding protein, inhibits growth in stationary phase, ElaB/YqjD/DUF883 family [Halomonas ilicicola DSM 19980]
MAMYPVGQHDREASTEQLKEDLRHLSHTIEELVSATADDSRGNIKELRDRAEKRLRETRSRLEARGEKIYHDTRDGVLDGADAFDRYVHQNPWTSIGIGTAVGVVIGMIVGRR